MTFGRWLRGCIVMSVAFAAVFLIVYLLPLPENLSIPAQLRRGSRTEQLVNHVIFWGSLSWWGIAWPWVLAAMHRGPAERLLRQILGEVDAAVG